MVGEKKGGIFIAFEGGELLGKSTQFHLAEARLTELYPEHMMKKSPREPGGSSIGEIIRYAILRPDVLAKMVRIMGHLKLNPRHRSEQFQADVKEVLTELDRSKEFMDFTFNANIHPLTEAFLFQVSRAQVRSEIVIPWLEQGRIVLIDRCGYSSDVYQGLVRGLGLSWIESLNVVSEQGRRPDLVICFTIEPEKGLDLLRGSARDHKRDRLDRETLDFHRKIFEGYKMLPKLLPENLGKTFTMIDYQKYMRLPKEESIKRTHDDIMAIITEFIEKNRVQLA
jgi:dTMP kinase